MKTNRIFKTLFISLAATLLSSTAFAQLSLSADAKATADTTGAEATGDATATDDTAADETAMEEEEEETAPASMVVSEPAPAASSTPAGSAGYDGGFFIKSDDGNFKLVINGRAKIRFNYYNDEYPVIGDNGLPGTNHTNHANFSLPYSRLLLHGNVFSPKLGYMFYFDFATPKNVESYVTYDAIPGKLHLQIGLFKRPISRVYITSTAKEHFINQPLGQMGNAEDIGFQVSNNYTKAKGLEWAVAVMNGSLGGAPFNDFSPVLVGRIGFNNGIKGYANTDFEGGGLRFGVALSASTEFDHDNDNITQHYVSVDGMIKVHGLTASAAFYLQGVAGDFVWDDNTMGAIGSFIQAGYLINNFLEPVARYGMTHIVDVPDDMQEEITAGLTLHFFDNHRLKWENNISLLTQNRGAADTLRDIQFISQLQLAF
ncbi:MAG: hypothetical protein JXR91_01350 [Deltaproteobacteria bacterium]|nr:hypothetical protein [Deltaproteobacteria bacterium]